MLEISVTLVPFGDYGRAKALGTMTITNDGSKCNHPDTLRDYDVTWRSLPNFGALYADGRRRTVRVINHDRGEPVENLIAKAFAAISENQPPETE